MADSHRPVSMRQTMSPVDVPITIIGGSPPIAAETPRTEASCPPASTGPVENAPSPAAVAPVHEAAARAQLTSWWCALHPEVGAECPNLSAAAHVPRPHVSHPQHPIWRTPRFPDLTQANAPATRDYGCPPSLGAACR
jgi:hypothetical protein